MYSVISGVMPVCACICGSTLCISFSRVRNSGLPAVSCSRRSIQRVASSMARASVTGICCSRSMLASVTSPDQIAASASFCTANGSCCNSSLLNQRSYIFINSSVCSQDSRSGVASSRSPVRSSTSLSRSVCMLQSCLSNSVICASSNSVNDSDACSRKSLISASSSPAFASVWIMCRRWTSARL